MPGLIDDHWFKCVVDFGRLGPDRGQGGKSLILPPGIDKNKPGMIQNADGSWDIYFGPEAPKGKENNWVQTVPGKGWFTILRIYGPLQPWIDKAWRPGEIELVK